jgi:DNA-directed RNA polymerase specialized sigma subunit
MEIFKGATRHQTTIDSKEAPVGLSLGRLTEEKIPNPEDIVVDGEEEKEFKARLEGLNFSPRQSQVLQYLNNPLLTREEIAHEMGLSKSRIQNLIDQIRKKVLTAMRHGKF